MPITNTIPFPNENVVPVTRLPGSILQKRSTIVPDKLMNSANIEYDYLDELCQFVYDETNHNVQTIEELINISRRINMFTLKNKTEPFWHSYKVTRQIWTAYDEISATVISSSLAYDQLSLSILYDAMNSNEGIEDQGWKKAVNMVKASLSLLDAFRDHICDINHDSNMAWVTSVSKIIMQALPICRNVYETYNAVNLQFGAFDSLPSNSSIFKRILICEYNKISALKRIQSSFANEVAVDCYLHCAEICYCYYSAMEYYNKGELGIALGLVKYGLLRGTEQSTIKSKIRLGKKKNKEFKRNTVWKENIRLSKALRIGLEPIFVKFLILLIQLLKILYCKFEDMNNNISFKSVISSQEVEQSYLFSASNLPTGLEIPLRDIKPFHPRCLVSNVNDNSNRNYF